MNQERIDNYVMDKMSAEERISFEQDIANDAELQSEVALHRDVVRAIRLKAAKEQLQKVERQIRAEEHRRKVFTIRIAAAALAACLVVGVFVDDYYSDDYKRYAAGIEVPPPRDGGYEVNEVVYKINDKDYAEALALIDKAAMMKIDEREQQDLEWYKAVTYMHMGKWMKARKLLKQIANSDSIHKVDAEQALKEL